MTPLQKLKYLVLLEYAHNNKETFTLHTELSGEEVDDIYDELEWDEIKSYQSELRECYDDETNIEPPYCRHYEAKSVASQLPDGSWVGWTYWYGGGKHGEPEAIDWMEDAYHLDCVEKQELVTVRSFSKSKDNNEN